MINLGFRLHRNDDRRTGCGKFLYFISAGNCEMHVSILDTKVMLYVMLRSASTTSHFSCSLGAHFSQISSRLSLLNLFAKAN